MEKAVTAPVAPLEGGVVAPGVAEASAADKSDAGWTTKTPGRKGSAGQKARNEGLSPRFRVGNNGKNPSSKDAKQHQRTAKPSFPPKGTRPQGENGDGRASFYKLQELLRSEAPPEYIFQMVVRIHDLAQQRRLEEFESRINAIKDEEERAKLQANWTDSLPAKTLERFGRFADQWDYTIRDDKLRLARTVYSWLI
ncbi:hypothetical protein PHYSODRAFT_295661 [Phytophthora sojae]|uniref:Uncharacterized protein n=1 Tax=Phytophthora sojae (strain P6497) TaxID=1094619 RepID=G4YUV9_PHYSP|nr:hypothetical protein PHYSODRAFT_295661 [Phytophthora sojae]EGZ23125.1 hypothetical protein PHYSODRAFT_295661 [Phytophthora sojae]|eukprot:XP_009518413.1 hypothetical protein PHYSODRAFT_295661 [Phytophthora sojae]